jgi:mannose-1-phosphate guanylyltransferase/mannose-6-phosphate isomerase
MTGNILPVILSGGSGSRLWPLSREACPKQFLNLSGEGSLFQQTAKRVSRFQDPMIVGNEENGFLMAEQLREKGLSIFSLILEPTPKDTAPAMALAALEAISTGHKHDVLLVLPADQIIDDEAAFMESIEAGLSLVSEGYIAMFGSTPTSPQTSYGYIEMGSDVDGYGYAVSSFNEKPDLQRAKEFYEAGNFLWSTGIFMFTPAQYMDLLEQYDAEIARRCRVAHVERRVEDSFVKPGKDAFESNNECSLTYVLTDFIKKLAVVPLMTPWTDVGGWGDLWNVLPKDVDGNHIQGTVVTMEDTKNSLIHSENGMTAVLGLEDVVVIQTADATLVADKKKANLVKKVFQTLRDKENSKHALYRKQYMSWGHTELMQEEDGRRYKHVTVNPESQTEDKQYSKRITHWIITKGNGMVSMDGEKKLLKTGESVCFRPNTSYNISNTAPTPLEMMEIALGDMNEVSTIQSKEVKNPIETAIFQDKDGAIVKIIR